MTCRTLLLAHARMAQPLAWSGGSLCVAYARASMPRVSRGPRRPPRHAWHRLVRPNLAAPAAASLPAIIVGPSMAAGAAGEAAGGRGNKNTIAFKRSRPRPSCNKPVQTDNPLLKNGQPTSQTLCPAPITLGERSQDLTISIKGMTIMWG